MIVVTLWLKENAFLWRHNIHLEAIMAFHLKKQLIWGESFRSLVKLCVCLIVMATDRFWEIAVWWPVVVTTALVLTFCICQAQCWGVEAAWLPGPSGQTDGPAPARARPALRLGQGYIGIWRLVKDLEVQRGVPVTQYKFTICVFLTNPNWYSNCVFEVCSQYFKTRCLVYNWMKRLSIPWDFLSEI